MRRRQRPKSTCIRAALREDIAILVAAGDGGDSDSDSGCGRVPWITLFGLERQIMPVRSACTGAARFVFHPRTTPIRGVAGLPHVPIAWRRAATGSTRVIEKPRR